MQLLKNVPEALFNVLIRPIPGDPGSWLKYPAIAENFLLYGLLIFLGFNLRYADQKQTALILGIFAFGITLSLLIGWVTPVLGAINRYRTPVILGIGIILLILGSVRHKKERT